MENIKHKSEDVAKKEFTPKETACSSGSKEYNTFIDTIPVFKEGGKAEQISNELNPKVLKVKINGRKS